MKHLIKGFLLLTALAFSGCDEDALLPSSSAYDENSAFETTMKEDKALKTTGEVEVTFISNPGGKHDMGNAQAVSKTRFALVDFNAHEASKNNDAKGDIQITIMNEAKEVKRILKADVYATQVFPNEMEARFLARVYSDERMDGGHSGNHTDTGDDHTGSSGGNGNGGPDKGGHDEGTHDDGTHDDGDHGGGCNSGDEDHGNKSRIGQVIGVKVYDGGSPGTNGDLLFWRWYAENNPNEPDTGSNQGWGDMCEKTIVSGNLVVHVK